MRSAFAQARAALNTFLSDEAALTRCESIADALAAAFRAGNKVLICGNGGSLCDAMHFAEELTGRFRSDRPALPAIALSDPGHITCVGNDYGFDAVFARAIEALGKPGDLLIALSTSGNSPNIRCAVDVAKSRGLRTVSLLGRGGGELAGRCDHEVIVPGATSDRVQELHMLILHALVEAVENRLFPAA